MCVLRNCNCVYEAKEDATTTDGDDSAWGEGDTNFNKWNVPVIPFHQLRKCNKADHHRIFKLEDYAEWYDHADGVEVHSGQMAVESDSDYNMPFLQEHHMLLGQEMINVFGGELLIMLKPGAGEMLTAALIKHVWAIAICRDAAHKTLI